MHHSILAIETCGENCSVAVTIGGNTQQLLSTEPRGHADNILPMIEQLLQQLKVNINDLDAIAFTRGPGAFTGVRIGTSVAQGLAVATALPLIAVSSLAVLAQGSYRETENKQCLAALDARMSEVYFGMYQLNNNGLMVAVQEEQVAAPVQIDCKNETVIIAEKQQWQAIGPGWINYEEAMQQRFQKWQLHCPERIQFPQAIDLLCIAQSHFAQGKLLDPADALPVYVRDQIVKS